MRQEEKQTKLHFRFTKNGFLLDGQEAEYAEALLPWRKQFEADRWRAVYAVGFEKRPEWLDAAGCFLYQIANRFQELLTRRPDLEVARERVELVPEELTLEQLLNSVPFTLGSEFVDAEWLRTAFEHLREVFAEEIAAYEGTVALYLADKSQQLRVPERIFFHLVESREEEYPFAFLATYATKDGNDKVRHMPLQYALTEYKAERAKLLELLACLNRAAEVVPLIGEFVDRGELFHPLRLTAEEAYQILKAVPQIEEVGIVCRIPNWWKKNAYGVTMAVNLGEEKPPMLGLETILCMVPQLVVDGVPLTREEIEMLLGQTEGLALLKGKWVEADHARLQRLLDEMEQYGGELTLMDALRMGIQEQKKGDADGGVIVTNGTWLSKLLQDLRMPKRLRSAVVPKTFHATLRPYQKDGFTWLDHMNQLHFGACLADDMGLGKTVQVLAFLEKLRKSKKDARVLLIVPASLLGNWQKEAEKFAPEMPYTILHGSSASQLGKVLAAEPAFLTITTYGMASRIEGLDKIQWDCLILDEAQAIKNPLTKQTKRIKTFRSSMRIAMTGTPIENDLTNLWSLFDFLNKGLLGSSDIHQKSC